MTTLIRRVCNENWIICTFISCRGRFPRTGRDGLRPVHAPSTGQSAARSRQIRRAGEYSRAPVRRREPSAISAAREIGASAMARAWPLKGPDMAERQQQVIWVVGGYMERTHEAMGEG